MHLFGKKTAFFLSFLILISGSLVQLAQASNCKEIDTRLNGSTFLCGESPVGLCSNGIINRGILKSTKLAAYTSAAPSAGLWTEPPTVLSYSADAVFTSKQGALYLNQLGVVDTERNVFTEINRVVGGTGRFANASGDLFISGTNSSSEFVTNFTSKVTGTLCLAGSDDDDDEEEDDEDD